MGCALARLGYSVVHVGMQHPLRLKYGFFEKVDYGGYDLTF